MVDWRVRWRRPAAVFLLVLGVGLIVSGGHSYSTDEETYLANLRAALHGEHSIVVSQQDASAMLLVPDNDGGVTSFYGVGTIVFNLPAYAVGRTVATIVPAPFEEPALRLFFFGNGAVVLALTAACLVAIGRALGTSDRQATLVALAYATGTFAFVTAKTGFAETWTACFVTIAILQVLRWRSAPHVGRHVMLTGLALGAATMMRSSAVLLVVPFVLLVGLTAPQRTRLRHLALLAAGLSVPFAAVALNNWWRWGNPLDAGYEQMVYTTPVYEGVYGLFLSSGRGLFWFAPITLLAVFVIGRAWRASMPVTMLLVGCILVQVALFSRFVPWSGGNAFGPRYLLSVLPAFAVLVLLAASRVQMVRSITVAWAAGVVTNVSGALVYFNAVYAANLERLRLYADPSGRTVVDDLTWKQLRNVSDFTPRFSLIRMQMDAVPKAVRHLRDLPLHAEQIDLFGPGLRPQLIWYQAELKFDTWWAYWWEIGGPRWILLLALVPIAAVVMGVRLMRSAPVVDSGPVDPS